MTNLSRSRMYQLFLAACVLCLSFAMATQALAAEKGKGRNGNKKCYGQHYGRHRHMWQLLMKLDLDANQKEVMSKMTERLNLTEEQETKIRPIIEESIQKRLEILKKVSQDWSTTKNELLGLH